MTAWRDGNVAASSGGELSAKSGIKTMVNGDTIFTITGELKITGICSRCVTANNATETLLKYIYNPTGLIATQLEANTSTLASAITGTLISLIDTLGTNQPIIYPNGVGVEMTGAPIIVPAGALKLWVSASTTGTWQHYITYVPLEPGATIVGV